MSRKSSRKKKRLKQTTCVYCGEQADCTDEHVIAGCLFPETARPSRDQFIIIPVCGPCNASKAREDSYMRDILAADVACNDNPIVRAVLPTVFRSTAQRWSEFGRDYTRKARLEPVYSPGGIYVGDHPGVPIDQTRITRYFGLVARGLHWHAFNERWPDDHVFQQRRLHQQDAAVFADEARRFPDVKTLTIGEGVFNAIFIKNPHEESFFVAWLLQFYGCISYMVISGPKSYFENHVTPPAKKASFGFW